MRAATLILFAAMVVMVSCRPDKPDLKQLKADAARKKACMRACTSSFFEPVCAGKQGERSKSFGSVCVMDKHNCEHNDTLQVVTKGECSPSDGIILA